MYYIISCMALGPIEADDMDIELITRYGLNSNKRRFFVAGTVSSRLFVPILGIDISI